VATERVRRWSRREAWEHRNIASILAVRVAGGVLRIALKGGSGDLPSMGLEWHDGIRVNASAGYIAQTDRDFLESEAGQKMRQRIPQRRFGTPQDLDGPLCYWLPTPAATSGHPGHRGRRPCADRLFERDQRVTGGLPIDPHATY